MNEVLAGALGAALVLAGAVVATAVWWAIQDRRLVRELSHLKHLS